MLKPGAPGKMETVMTMLGMANKEPWREGVTSESRRGQMGVWTGQIKKTGEKRGLHLQDKKRGDSLVTEDLEHSQMEEVGGS